MLIVKIRNYLRTLSHNLEDHTTYIILLSYSLDWCCCYLASSRPSVRKIQ